MTDRHGSFSRVDSVTVIAFVIIEINNTSGLLTDQPDTSVFGWLCVTVCPGLVRDMILDQFFPQSRKILEFNKFLEKP